MSDFQKISIVGSTEFDSEGKLTVTLRYDSSSAETNGIGFKLHFDGASLAVDSITNVFANATASGAQAAGSIDVNGHADDQELSFGWAAISGNFPGSEQADLATITFSEVSGGSDTNLYVSPTSVSVGYEFQTDHGIPAIPLDITELPVNENAGENQVIATVANGPSGATYELVDNTVYSSEETQVIIPQQATSTQHLYVSESTLSDDGTQVALTVSYKADNPELNGIGFVLHFDSSVLSLDNISSIFSGAIASGAESSENIDDEDANTDRLLSFGWASISGNFPGQNQVDLAVITFNVDADASGVTPINFTPTSTAAGYAFNAQDHLIQLPVTSPLSIDSSTGAVSLSVNPDFESVPSYDFEIVTADGAYGSSASVNVVNVDESAAIFDSASGSNTVAENATVIYTAVANDSADVSAGVTYSLSGADASLLNIDENSGEVTVIGGPDYETKTSYSFTVSVTDGVNAPGPASEQAVTVAITNIDDTGPVFTSATEVTAVENSGSNQVVYQAIAEDAISDVTSGPLTYSLVDDANGVFTTDSSGNVSLVTNPDYETQSSYGFTVRAADGNNNSTDQAVSLSISDIVVEKPVFDETTPDPVLDENTAFSYIAIASVDSQATDQGIGETIVYSLSDDANGAFVIDSESGVVSMTVATDFEQGSGYSFTVVATDDAGNFSEKTVFVTINNLDEVSPTFGQTSVVLDPIIENSGAGKVIYTAQADDSGDISDGVSYSFAAYPSTNTTLAEAAENTQHVYISETTRSADGSQLTAIVSYNSSATDTAGLGLRIHFDSSVVSLSAISDALGDDLIFASNQAVADIDDKDNNPDTDSFVDAAWASVLGDWPDGSLPANLMTLIFEINDSSAVSTVVGISAIDSSQGFEFDGQALTVPLAPLTTLGSLTIDPTSGEVVLLDNPDYEAKDEYNFSVLATDAAGNKSDPLLVSLAVSDEQLGIASSNIAQALDENSGAGQVIYSTAVSGVEEQTNINYSLLSDVSLQQGAIEQRFAEQQDGSITLQLFVNPSLLSNYPNSLENFDLVIGYDDLLITQNSVSVAAEAEYMLVEETVAGEVKVAGIFLEQLPNISDNPLVELNFKFEEGIGSVEFSITDVLIGTDHDPLQDSVSRYYDSRGFTIDEATGNVTLVGDPDYESKSNYIFSVMATDASRGQSVIETVTLDINNVDDTAPIVDFVGVVDELSIVENSGTDQQIFTAAADDASDISEGFTFSLAGADANLFAIDATTGVVTLLENPDFEAKASYNFSVVATDAAGNMGQKEAVITVVNVDDTAPVITSNESISIDENSGENQVVYTASAVDSDFNGQQEIVFSLDDSSDNVFSINAQTGEVTLADDPDYEAQDQYSFTVIATDGSGNQSAAKTVNLSVNDVDDFVLTGNVYHWSTQSLMDDVSVTMHHKDGGQHIDTVSTDTAGNFVIDELAADDVVVTLDRDLQPEDQGRLVTSLDALAALKIAVGLNPNAMDDYDGDQVGISPYQFLAADVNKSGKITSADALEILRMAVRAPDAIEKEWMFVDESEDFWDETANDGEGALTVDRWSVDVDNDGAEMTVEEASEKNFVGVLLGDVYSNWQAPDDSHSMDYNNFVDLENAGTAPMYQWGLSPQYIPLEIDSDETAVSIDENSGELQQVYTVSANDDATYTLGSGEDADKFEIDTSSGVVVLTENPDFESQQSYSFEVIAATSDGRSDSQTISLTINNIDDSAPTITSGDTANNIVENSGVAQVVYIVTAEDDASDIQALGDLTFSLSGTDASAFTINQQNGEVTLISDPDFEGQSQYSFDVIATDTAGNASNAKTVTLSVIDIDDTAPVITSSDVAPTVVENSGSNQVVYNASASDNSDGDLSYSIVGNLGLVLEENAPDLLANTQHIYVSKRELSEDGSQVALTLSYLVDNASLSGIGFTANFDSSVLSLSEVSNVFEGAIASGEQSAADAENSDIDSSSDQMLSFGWASISGTFPGATSANLATITFDIVDADAITAQLNFVKTSSAAGYAFDAPSYDNVIPEADIFSIDSQTGDVSLLVDPDYETTPQYSFDITATDSVGNVSSPKTITLDIEDADEISPVFASNSVIPNPVDDSSSVGVVVYTTSATDAGGSDAISYSLTGTDASAFSINSSGEITLNSETDYAVQSSYSFAVIATDTAGNVSQPQTITLAVNEPSPTITSTDMGEVLEGAGSDQVVYTATSNIAGASYSLVDETVYPDIETVITIPDVQANTQHVYISDSLMSEDGSQVTVTVSHNASGSLYGLGLRIHYDSNDLTLSGVNEVLQDNLISGPFLDALDDTANLDGDETTDSYVISSWAAITDNWTLDYPDVLMKLTFDITEGAMGYSAINFSKTSTTAGYTFDGQNQDLVISAVAADSSLSIDSASGAVTLAGEADYQNLSNYRFTVTADNGTDSASQDVGLAVADVLVTSDSYDGSENADVIALGLGSAEVTSGSGEDVYVIAQTLDEWSTSAHTLTDFDSSADAIDVSAALLAAGYTGISSAEGVEENLLNQMTNVSSDVLDLISSNDSSLDNAIGSNFDDATNVLTIFADSDSSAGSSAIESIEISIGDGSTVEEDDLTLAAFIA